MSWHYLIPIHGFNYNMKEELSLKNFHRDGSLRDAKKWRNERFKRELKTYGLFMYGIIFGIMPIAIPVAIGSIHGIEYASKKIEDVVCNPEKIGIREDVVLQRNFLEKIACDKKLDKNK